MKSGESGSPRRAGRRLTAEEQALWKAATRAVQPLRRAPVPDAAREAPAVEQPAEGPPSPPSHSDRSPGPASATAPRKPPRPSLAGIDRRLKQRIGRGAAAIEARLDLHGLTQERAHAALLRFLRIAQVNEAKLVLVITGKGARGDEAVGAGERGVLKRLVPQWLGLPEFRPYVIGFDAAHVGHGGEGALYVRVRRAR